MNFSLFEYAGSCQVNDPAEFVEKCAVLRDFLIEANRTTNLTRITEEPDFSIKHVADSLGMAKCFPHLAAEEINLADLGCGAGFPSLVLALAFPRWRITSIDSTGKKINFVRSAAEHLGLTNLTAIHGRVNELNRRKEFQFKFDVVTARAVATAPGLARDASNFPAKAGKFILYKTPGQAEEDMPVLKKDFRNFHWETTEPYQLPGEAGTRLFVTGARLR